MNYKSRSTTLKYIVEAGGKDDAMKYICEAFKLLIVSILQLYNLNK